MKLIIKRKRVNNSKRKTSSNNMAKKSKKKSSSSRSSGVFSGKILGMKIPVVSGILKNKTFQKAAAGAGVVSIVTSLALLLNNATVNRAVANPIVRLGLAGAGGDITGIAAEIARNPQLISQVTGQFGGGQQTPSQSAEQITAGFA